jgi:hypothetical protein
MSVVNVQPNRIIAVNQLQLGVHPDWQNWVSFVNEAIYGELLRNANIKLIRVFDFRPTTPKLMPCTYWDEATKTGTWDWTNVDAFTGKVFEVGAEPLFCLGWARSTAMQDYVPLGMALNPTTGLPYPDSYAAYAREWVRHFKQAGLPVRFYEIMNEPYAYFGWTPDASKLAYFTDLYNASALAMKAENPALIIGNDFNTRKQVLDYWLSQGVETDSLNFHKYDSGVIDPSDPSYRTDAQIFNDAETRMFTSSPLGRSVKDSQQLYYAQRGKLLPIINSESNMNYAWEDGSDPRIVRMSGAVWLALVLRTSMLNGLSFHVHFNMAGSRSWEQTKPLDGAGFGLIDSDSKRPWGIYYVCRIIGPNLDVGDSIVEAITGDARLRVIAWHHKNQLKILVINKTHDLIDVTLQGAGTCSYWKIDETMPYDNVSIMEGTINAGEPLRLEGYTVLLATSVRRYVFKRWQDGDTNPSKVINM